MKNLIFIFLLISLNSTAATIKFERLDSIRTFNGIAKGKSATFKVKDQLYQMGVFEINDPLGVDESAAIYRFMAVIRINDKKEHSFYEDNHYVNNVRLRDLKYIYLENELFYINSINNDSMVIEKRDIDLNIINGSYQICFRGVFNLKSLHSELENPQKNKVLLSQLFIPGKLNVLYFTMDHCPPCEKNRPEIIKLYYDNEGVNLIIAAPFDSKFNSGYDTIPQKFYFADKNLNRNGFPEFLIFDKAGNLIPNAQLKGGALAYIRRFQNGK